MFLFHGWNLLDADKHRIFLQLASATGRVFMVRRELLLASLNGKRFNREPTPTNGVVSRRRNNSKKK
jgi:hypothetical protein